MSVPGWSAPRALAWGALVLLAATAGCAGPQLDALAGRMASVERNRKQLEEEFQTLRTRNADLRADMDRLDGEVRDVRGRLEELAREIDGGGGRSPVRTDGIGSDVIQQIIEINNRLVGVEERLGLVGMPPAGGGPSGTGTEPLGAGGGPTGFRPSAPILTPAEPGPEDFYREAYRAFQEGRFADARQGFGRYLGGDPRAELADDALFWMGESYFAERSFEDALIAFDRVVREHPQGNKVPSALLKQALCFLELGYEADARTTLLKVVDRHPDSDEAQLARDRLKTLLKPTP